MPYKGKKNVYTCKKCKAERVTVDTDEGVTPFMIRCESAGCNEMMTSSFYQVDQELKPSHEWYSPKRKERRRLKRSSPATLEHVEKGGLLLRPIQLGVAK